MPVESSRGGDDEDLGDPVPVVYASSVEEAEWYCQLLEDHDIHGVIDEDYTGPPPPAASGPRTGVPVLVPESLAEESREIIAKMDEVEVFDEEQDDDENDFGLGFNLSTGDEQES